MKKLLLLFAVCVTSIGWVWAQNQTISGKVVHAFDSEPVVGASVVVVGTTTGTITGVDGSFTLTVPQGAKLMVSYIGMKTIEVSASDGMTIRLEESAEKLEEVVVTALGITRSERTIGYAATTVKADEVVSARQSNVANALAGKVAGVQVQQTSTDPGSSTNIIIRGFSSIGGSNQPLYVVDGVPLQNLSSSGHGSQDEKVVSLAGISNISPKDIESMTILKGAAATALYGSRAANGVIIINTRSGVKGTRYPFNVEYSGGVAFNQVAILPIFQNEFGQGWEGDQTFIENGSWGPAFDGSMQVMGPIWNHQQILHKYEAVPTNVYDFFDIGLSHNHNVSFSGASSDNKMTYYTSYSYTGDDGIMPGDKDVYKRHTLAFRGSYEPVKWVKVSSSVNFATSQTDAVDTYQGVSVIDGLYELPRDVSLVDHQDLSSAFNTPEAWITPYGITNPYWAIANNYNHSNAKQIFGKLQVDVRPIDQLTLTYRFGFDYADADRKIGVPEIALDDALITNHMGYPPSSLNQTGSVWAAYNRNYELNHDVLLTYADKWGIFDLNAVVGMNANQRGSTAMGGATSGLTFHSGFWQLSNGANRDELDESQRMRRSIGVFADVTLGFFDQLYIDLTARNDWSSTLPISANSYFYPGITASWLFSELIPTNKVLTHGKLRAAYGWTGNDAGYYLTNPYFIQGYAITPYLGSDGLTFPLGGQNAFISTASLGSATLRPELTKETEVGLNLQFFQSRLGLDAAYYYRLSEDQIFTLPVDPATGYSSMVTNFGTVRNHGFELLLNTTPINIGGFRWDLDFNFAMNFNKVLSLPDGLEGGKSIIQGFSTSSDAVYIYAEVGKPLGEIYTYLPEKTEDGRLIVGSDGLPIVEKELKPTGKNVQSKWTGGVTTSLSYKGVSLSATLDVRMGGYMFSRTKNLMQFTGNGIITTYNGRQPFIIPNSVVKNADGSYSPNMTPIYQDNGSFQDWANDTGFGEGGEFYLVDRSFAKLRNISLSWTLPKKWVNRIALDDITLSAYVNNVYTWTAKDNYYNDPEASSYAGNGDLSAQFGELYANPSCRQYGINLHVKF